MWRKFIFLLLLPAVSMGSNIDCRNIREGIYKSHDLYGSLRTIIRTNDKQTETWGRSAKILEYDVQWTSDCTYILLNQKVVVGNDSMLLTNSSDTIYNEIIEANRYWHTIATTINGCDPKVVISYFNVDTISQYRDLTQLDRLKDYEDVSTGATFVGYNYAVTYKQSSVDTSNYLIAFLEALMVYEKSKFKMLDVVYCTLDTSQKITTSNCRFNDNYDKEIIAIYSSTNSKEEAQIIKAWRFNKVKQKIEEVEAEKVKYKEVDKWLMKWSNQY